MAKRARCVNAAFAKFRGSVLPQRPNADKDAAYTDTIESEYGTQGTQAEQGTGRPPPLLG